MALKHKVTKEEYEKLNKVLQAEYSLDGDTATLSVEGIDDPVELKKAKDKERDARKAAEKQIKDLQAERDALIQERDEMLKGNVPKGDVEKLETSYKTKLEKREKELTGEISTLRTKMQTLLVDDVAKSMAVRISISPDVILPHIRSRLTVEESNGDYVTKVLDAKGAPSASTVEDLEKEFLANKAFSPILTGSKASGGAGGGSGNGGAGSGANGSAINFKGSAKQIAEQLRNTGRLQERA